MSTKRVKKIIEYELMFNDVIIELVEYIVKYYPMMSISCGRYFPNQSIKTLKTIIIEFIKSKPQEPILQFLQHIYRNDLYRESLRGGNDNFFIGTIDSQSYDSDNSEIENDMIKKLFEFKEIWNRMDENTKQYIKKSMKCLVVISENYVKIM
jgi:hypothetical protein